MARADLNVRLGLAIRDFERDLKRVERSLRRTARNLSSLGSDLTAGLTVPIAGAAAASLQAAAQFEQLQNALIAVTGSTEEAQAQLERLREIAEAPGIGFEEAVRASLQFQGLGVSAQQAEESIKQVANAVAASGGGQEAFAGVVQQLNQIQAKNQVLQEDIGILLENAPILGNVLQETFGAKTAEGIREAGVNGEQFFEQLIQGLSKLERVQGSLANTFENFGISVRFALADIGQQINDLFDVQGIIDDFVDKINDAVDVFRGLDDETKRSIIRFAAFAAAVGPAIFVTGRFAGIIGTLIGFNRQFSATVAGWVGSLFTYTTGAKAAEVVTKRFNTALKLTFAGIALTAITLIVVKFLEWRNALRESQAELNRVTTQQEAFNSVTSDAEKSIASQRLEIERFVAIAQDETATQERRTAAIQKLKKEYPEYFGQVSEDLTKTGQLTIAKNKLIDALLAQARAQAAVAKITELENERLDLQTDIADKRVAQEQALAKIRAAGFSSIQEANQALLRNRKLIQEQAASGGQVNASLLRQGKALGELVGRYQAATQEVRNVQGSIGQLERTQRKLAESFDVTQLGGEDPDSTDATVTTGSTGRIDAVTKALEKYQQGLEQVRKEAEVFGTSIDEQLNQKADLARQAIEELLAAGLEPTAEVIRNLKSGLDQIRLDRASTSAANFAVNAAAAGAAASQFAGQGVEPLANSFGNLGGAVQSAQSGISSITPLFTAVGEGMAAAGQRSAELREQLVGIANLATGVLQEGFSGFFQVLAEGGTNAFQAFTKAIKQLIVQLVTAVATAAALAVLFTIISGGAGGIAGVKNLLGFSGGGSLFGGFLKGLIPGLAEGGIVPPGYPNDTYLARLSSGEVVARPEKLESLGLANSNDINVTGRIVADGSDLAVVLERAQYNRTRTRGR